MGHCAHHSHFLVGRVSSLFKVTTFNVNSLRARLEVVIPWLQANEPDVLCLQETKVRDTDFPEAAFTDAGWNVVYHGQKSYNGVAIISRHPIEETARGLNSDGLDEQARLIRAKVADIHIINAYVPQGSSRTSQKFSYKLQWLAQLQELIDNEYSTKDKLIVCGDLNMAPSDDDVYDAQRLWGDPCFCREVQEIYHELLEWGFVDVFRKHLKGGGHYTYFDYRLRNALNNGLGWRIDHILATKSLSRRSKGVDIDLELRKAERPSDHIAVTAKFAV